MDEIKEATVKVVGGAEKKSKVMSEKEKKIVEKIKKAMPNLSEFDIGYFLGKVESLADEAEKKPDTPAKKT